MMAVIFEVWPAEGRRDEYLKLAASLREELATMDGFVSIDRFESLYEEGKLLSLQFWRDEASIAAWRMHVEHRKMQRLGRGGVFRAYRLRVAEVVRDYSMTDRNEAPADLRAHDKS
ncbi:MAG: antibiotic biosynthesis monooxygenase [Rhizobiales bacterium]|nr:antibiotic biosynthesis monooxygenase [Hyphomicrobiales bacterium]